MRKKIAIALSVVSILAVALAYGQNQSRMGQVAIPFKFMVAKQEMSSGTYEFVRQQDHASIITIRNLDTNKSTSAFVVERLAANPGGNGKVRVVFDTVGSQKFLSEFWPSQNQDGYLLGITKGEEKHEVVTQK